jgi:hypothetical protein
MPNKVVSFETLKWICLKSLYIVRSAVSALGCDLHHRPRFVPLLVGLRGDDLVAGV